MRHIPTQTLAFRGLCKLICVTVRRTTVSPGINGSRIQRIEPGLYPVRALRSIKLACYARNAAELLNKR